MSEVETARDPYVGLCQQIQEQARGTFPSYYTIGKVLSLSPMRIRAEGMDLDRDDLKLTQHLLPGWAEELTGLAWPVEAWLPTKTFTDGTCSCMAGNGTVEITRPAETVSGRTAEQATIIRKHALQVGDEVLMLKSKDQQTYYVIDKLVEAEQ